MIVFGSLRKRKQFAPPPSNVSSNYFTITLSSESSPFFFFHLSRHLFLISNNTGIEFRSSLAIRPIIVGRSIMAERLKLNSGGQVNGSGQFHFCNLNHRIPEALKMFLGATFHAFPTRAIAYTARNPNYVQKPEISLE